MAAEWVSVVVVAIISMFLPQFLTGPWTLCLFRYLSLSSLPFSISYPNSLHSGHLCRVRLKRFPPPPLPQTPQITPYRQLPPSKRSRRLTACMIKSGTPLGLRSGPKKLKVTLPEPVHIHSDPGLPRPINWIYGPELNLNLTFLIIWLLTPLRTKKKNSELPSMDR